MVGRLKWEVQPQPPLIQTLPIHPTTHLSPVPGLSVISNWCKSFVFGANLFVRVHRTILVWVDSILIENGWPLTWRHAWRHCAMPKSWFVLISGCRWDREVILVSFLTFLRSENSIEIKLFTWPWRMTLEIEGQLPVFDYFYFWK